MVPRNGTRRGGGVILTPPPTIIPRNIALAEVRSECSCYKAMQCVPTKLRGKCVRTARRFERLPSPSDASECLLSRSPFIITRQRGAALGFCTHTRTTKNSIKKKQNCGFFQVAARSTRHMMRRVSIYNYYQVC